MYGKNDSNPSPLQYNSWKKDVPQVAFEKRVPPSTKRLKPFTGTGSEVKGRPSTSPFFLPPVYGRKTLHPPG
jgi:hypothetical protein